MLRYRFEGFEFRPQTGEFFRDGEKVRLQPQPLQILALLLARPGELVTRQELAEALWGGSAQADIETGLNIAVKKLRDALGDSAVQPRLIETLPRRGYRFIGTVGAAAGTVEEPQPVSAPSSTPPRSWKHLAWIGIPALALIVLAAVWVKPPFRTEALDFKARDAVVVAQFSNETGEQNLDGVVETVLEAELAASPFVTVAPPERIGDALRLMRRPVIPRVPPALAREVCQRDPGLRAAVAGSIRKVGAGYLLIAQVIRPADGQPVVTLSESAGGRDEILRAVRRLSASIRTKLGESAPGPTAGDGSVEKVTTNSLDALRLYSEANRLIDNGRWPAAESMLRQAIQFDPDFASAYVMLAFAIYNQRVHSRDEYMTIAGRALSLAGNLPAHEEQLIRGMHAYLDEDYERAKPFLEALFWEHRHEMWSGGQLILAYEATGDLSKRPAMWEEAARARPNQPRSYRMVSLNCFCGPREDPDRALRLIEKSVELAERQETSISPQRALTWLHQVRANIAWLRGDVKQCKAELDEARKLLSAVPHSNLPSDIAFGYFALGRFVEGDALLQQSPNPMAKGAWNLWAAILGGNAAAAARSASEAEKLPFEPLIALALVRTGRHAPVERMLTAYRRPVLNVIPQSVSAVRGELAFRQGRVKESIEILTRFLEDPNADGLYEQLPVALTLAQAHVLSGNHDKAIAVLEKATAAPRICNDFDRAVFWPYARFDLLKLYRARGRHPEAGALHKEIANLMQLADSGHPLLAALRHDAANPGQTR